jgi:hypothetical protein
VVEVLGPDLVGEAVGDQSFCGERFPSVIFKVSSRSVNLRVSGVALSIVQCLGFRRLEFVTKVQHSKLLQSDHRKLSANMKRCV